MLSVDFLEKSEYRDANWALQLSKKVLPDTVSQQQIDSFLKLANDHTSAATSSKESRKNSFSDIVRSGTQAASRGFGTILVYLLLIAVVTLFTFKIILSYWNNRSASSEARGHYLEVDDEFEEESNSQEIEFDDLEDLDALLDSQT
jgi:hypothetical protein